MYGQSAKEQYKAAYSLLREREKALRDGLNRFEENKRYYCAMSFVNVRFEVAAGKTAYNARQEFSGWVFFNWSSDLKDHIKYGQYKAEGFAATMYRSYARRSQERKLA